MADNRDLLPYLAPFVMLAKRYGLAPPVEADSANTIIGKCLTILGTEADNLRKASKSLDTIGKTPRAPHK